MFPAAKENGMDAFMQAIAHEAFHCFQDWNFDRPAYNNNAWWLEGSAEFFSNVVYQDKNNEYVYLEDFDDHSINKSLLQMDYENFLFFQYLANRMGEMGAINLLEALQNGGGRRRSPAADTQIWIGYFRNL